jgi:hypothetical protein
VRESPSRISKPLRKLSVMFARRHCRRIVRVHLHSLLNTKATNLNKATLSLIFSISACLVRSVANTNITVTVLQTRYPSKAYAESLYLTFFPKPHLVCEELGELLPSS